MTVHVVTWAGKHQDFRNPATAAWWAGELAGRGVRAQITTEIRF
jgi:hypothetical protein